MRSFLRLLLVFHFSFFIFHAATAQPLPERAPIIGKVLNTNGLPIGGAIVALNRQDKDIVGEAAFWGAKLLTGADGVFSFPEAEEGVYWLTIDAAGYENFGWTLEWQPQSPQFLAKMLKLTPQPLRILKPDGQPATGARAFMHLRGRPPGHVTFPSFVVGEEGKVTTEAITPASYWLHVVVPGVGYAILPDLMVKENEPQLVEVKLQAGGRVRGIARTSDGKAIGGVALSLNQLPPTNAPASDTIFQGNDGALYLQTQDRATLMTSDGNGELEIADVAPGRYQARFYMPGENNPIAQTIEVKAGETAQVSGLYNLQNNKSSLKVAVQSADGKPAANRWFTLRLQPVRNGNPVPFVQDGPPIPPDVAPTIVNLFQGALTRRFKTNNDGQAIIFPLRAGQWQATVIAQEQTGSKAAVGITSTVTVDDTNTQWSFKLKE